MIKKNILSFVAISIALVALMFSLFRSEKRIAFVNTIELFNGFTLKKNMELEFNNLKQKHQYTLDSIRMALQNIEMTIKTSGAKEIATNSPDFIRYRNIENEYLRLADAYEKQEIEKSTEMDQLIWTQLNQYCIDFSKKNGIDILFGASGNGSLMYGEQSMDVTQDLILFINASYEGKE